MANGRPLTDHDAIEFALPFECSTTALILGTTIPSERCILWEISEYRIVAQISWVSEPYPSDDRCVEEQKLALG